LAQGYDVISDPMACFRGVAEVGCNQQPMIVNGRNPKDLDNFYWIETVTSNLKTSLKGTFNALRFVKYTNH
jgi:hypothetical protein